MFRSALVSNLLLACTLALSGCGGSNGFVPAKTAETPPNTSEGTPETTPTPAPAPTPAPTATPEPAPTATPIPSPTATPAPTATPVPTPTATPVPTPTATPVPTPTATPVPTPTATPVPTPTATPVPTPTATPVPTPTATPVPTPTATPVPTPTATPVPTPTATPTPSPTPSPTPVASCPTNFVRIAANATLGTQAFCMAKFEMKDSNGTTVSQAALAPLAADRATAIAKCAAISYRLPTNREWNAAALEIFNVDANWTGGSVNSGRLYTGFYSKWSPPVSVSNESNPYDQTDKSSSSHVGQGKEERRTFTLASGEVIWDFGGNAWEWVSDTIHGDDFTPRLTVSNVRYTDNYWFPTASAQIAAFIPTLRPTSDLYYGALFGGNQGHVIRGGATQVNNSGAVGIFAAALGDVSASGRKAPASWGPQYDNVGFRCVTSLSNR